MNTPEARLVLQAYRLGGQDAAAPQFKAALEQLQRDPDLARWFKQEQAIDSKVQAKLRTALRPPAYLKARLLAQRKTARPAPLWRQPVWLAAAAAIVLLGVLATVWLKPPSDLPLFASFRQTMLQSASQTAGHVSYETKDLAQILQWVKDHGAAGALELPGALRGQGAQGCRIVDWNGHKVTMICFLLNGKDHLDLFVLDSALFRDLALSQTPRFAQANGLMTATWTKGDKTYLLASASGEMVLRKYL